MMETEIQISDREIKHEDSLQICDCGLIDYPSMLQKQLILCKKRQQAAIPNTVLFVEHPSVITLGARQSRNKMVVSRRELTRQNIDVVNIRRGGGTTAHNPGQLVIYPILDLQKLGLCIREYIRKLETIGSELLAHFGVNSLGNDLYPGLWIENRKIASIGVRVSRFITYHGMAINIHNNLNIFDYIVPCGLDDVEMTSVLKETGKRHSMTEVKNLLHPILMSHFQDSL